MPERSAYDPGTPSWVDLGTSDPGAAKRFYGSLFGWEAEDAGPPEETGGYAFFMLDGKRIAGVSGLMSEQQPVAWATYVSTDDADAVTARAREAGAMIVAEPMDVMDAGRMAFFHHPAAGAIGVWQPGRHTGAELVNEPGSFTWNELHTGDLAGAEAFGQEVFGWRAEEQDFGGFPYAIVHSGDAQVAGMTGMPPGLPGDTPAHWMVYFAVEDCDASAAQIAELGGSVLGDPMDIPGVGRFAPAMDPQGAVFAVLGAVQS
jgi:uncharacterized protein